MPDSCCCCCGYRCLCWDRARDRGLKVPTPPFSARTALSAQGKSYLLSLVLNEKKGVKWKGKGKENPHLDVPGWKRPGGKWCFLTSAFFCWCGAGSIDDEEPWLGQKVETTELRLSEQHGWIWNASVSGGLTLCNLPLAGCSVHFKTSLNGQGVLRQAKKMAPVTALPPLNARGLNQCWTVWVSQKTETPRHSSLWPGTSELSDERWVPCQCSQAGGAPSVWISCTRQKWNPWAFKKDLCAADLRVCSVKQNLKSLGLV